MNENDIKQLIGAYYDGELGADEAKEVAALIESDPAYRKYAEELKKLSSSLQTWNDEPLSPDLEQKIKMLYTHETSNIQSFTRRKRRSRICISACCLIERLCQTRDPGKIEIRDR